MPLPFFDPASARRRRPRASWAGRWTSSAGAAVVGGWSTGSGKTARYLGRRGFCSDWRMAEMRFLKPVLPPSIGMPMCARRRSSAAMK
jgi:hypothetical protein